MQEEILFFTTHILLLCLGPTYNCLKERLFGSNKLEKKKWHSQRADMQMKLGKSDRKQTK